MTKIFLDAGHGGKDSGAVGNGLAEKNLTLAIAQKMEKILKANYKNVQVMLTRSTDIFKTLAERTDQANAWGADVFVSVHINANTNPLARGFSTYIYPNADSKTKALHNVMHEQIFRAVSGYKVTDHGKKSADFHVLRESNMLAILTENFFISNSSDAALLSQEAFINRLAEGHVLGLEQFFGLEKVVVPPKPPISGNLYQVIVGTFSDRTLAEARANELKKLGYESYIGVKQ